MGAIWGQFLQILIEILNVMKGLVGSYGLAIILFTVLVRVLTYPLTQKQLESSKAMQELQPKIQALQKKYGKDKEKLSQETMQIYKEHGVNPATGCLPMVIQMPIWIGLYRALLQMAQQGTLKEGFLWIPTLAQPNGIGWLTSPANWSFPNTLLYLILPIVTVVSQVIVQRMITPAVDGGDDGQQAMMSQMMNFMPLMFGFFALEVPSGLTLYWATSNILQIVQQYFITGWDNVLPKAMRPAAIKAGQRVVEIDPPDKDSQKGSENVRSRKRKKRKR